MKDFKRVPIASRAEWRAWLKRHHDQAVSVWLVTYKKANARYVPYNDIVEEALCFGWIDSLPRKLNARQSMLLLSPRKAGSAWSRPNKQRAERMIAAGLMTPAGQNVIDAAKRNGLWTKLDSIEALTVPRDLAKAFDALSGSRANWNAFPRSAKRGILEWIAQAKRPETRAKRVAETAQKAALNQRANQWSRPEAKGGSPMTARADADKVSAKRRS